MKKLFKSICFVDYHQGLNGPFQLSDTSGTITIDSYCVMLADCSVYFKMGRKDVLYSGLQIFIHKDKALIDLYKAEVFLDKFGINIARYAYFEKETI